MFTKVMLLTLTSILTLSGAEENTQLSMTSAEEVQLQSKLPEDPMFACGAEEENPLLLGTVRPSSLS